MVCQVLMHDGYELDTTVPKRSFRYWELSKSTHKIYVRHLPLQELMTVQLPRLVLEGIIYRQKPWWRLGEFSNQVE